MNTFTTFEVQLLLIMIVILLLVGHMKNPKLETDLKGMDRRSDSIAS